MSKPMTEKRLASLRVEASVRMSAASFSLAELVAEVDRLRATFRECVRVGDEPMSDTEILEALDFIWLEQQPWLYKPTRRKRRAKSQ